MGAHWQSDVDAGRVVASACFARLHTNTEYLQQLERAKDEFRQKSGQVITEVQQLVIDDESDAADDPDMGAYTLDGRRATPESQGLIIRNRKVILRP